MEDDGNKQGKIREVFQNISEFRRSFQPYIGMLKVTNGHIVTDLKKFKDGRRLMKFCTVEMSTSKIT